MTDAPHVHIPTVDPVTLAAEAKLRYVLDTIPGITRVLNGEEFVYLDSTGRKITDSALLERINVLGIPPAWTDVWICPTKNGHIQATGKDEKGRKQYRYHDEWNKLVQEHKFHRMGFFSQALPRLRQQVEADMKLPRLSRRQVLATIVWLLEHTYIRIGNTAYAKEHKHYGLTTLRTKHVSVDGSTVSFDFVGKSGKQHSVEVTHPHVARMIRKLEELPGYELFQYLDDTGHRKMIDSSQVNEYLREIIGEHVSAKDFRTWGGTVLSAVTLRDLGEFSSKTQLKRNLSQAVETVAKHLRNTLTVSRNYYIHPVVPVTYEKGILIPYFQEAEKSQDILDGLSQDEQIVATLIQQHRGEV